MIYIILIIQALLELFIVMLIYTTILFTGFFVYNKILPYYRCWKDKRIILRCQKKYYIRLQRYRERESCRELHRKEREKYPLFYLNEGIV